MIIPLSENLTIKDLNRLIAFYSVEYPKHSLKLTYNSQGIQLEVREG